MTKRLEGSEGLDGRLLNDLNAGDSDDIDCDHDIDDGFDHLEEVDDDDPGRAEG